MHVGLSVGLTVCMSTHFQYTLVFYMIYTLVFGLILYIWSGVISRVTLTFDIRFKITWKNTVFFGLNIIQISYGKSQVVVSWLKLIWDLTIFKKVSQRSKCRGDSLTLTFDLLFKVNWKSLTWFFNLNIPDIGRYQGDFDFDLDLWLTFQGQLGNTVSLTKVVIRVGLDLFKVNCKAQVFGLNIPICCVGNQLGCY